MSPQGEAIFLNPMDFPRLYSIAEIMTNDQGISVENIGTFPITSFCFNEMESPTRAVDPRAVEQYLTRFTEDEITTIAIGESGDYLPLLGDSQAALDTEQVIQNLSELIGD